MNKKIIYLLSLLMALSLVFASCKKNGITDVKGDTNKEQEVKNETGGLTKTWEDLKKYDTNAMNDYAVISESGGDYYRNPVIVALGGANVLIVTEKRIQYPGSANDIGVNGDKPVSMVYLLSKDGGDNFDAPKPVVKDSQNKDDAVSAPVVYFDKTSKKVYVIASAGSGISRTGQYYADRNPKSQLKYSVGTVTGISGENAIPTIEWAEWKELGVKNANLNNIQFGTHSGRGIIADESGTKLILPIIIAEQGINGAAKEQMGVTFVKVTVTGDTLSIENDSTIGARFYFADGRTSGFSKYKEAKAIAYDGTKVTYLVVPNPAGGDGKMGLGDSQKGQQATDTVIAGSEGSFGFLKLAKGWYGSTQYEPASYKNDGKGSGQDEILFSHVKTPAGENHMYLLDAQQYQPQNKSFKIAITGKSSSIDVLDDGTIIVAAEKERNTKAEGLKFNIFFSRYTQSYLSSQLESK
ncbi:sialidase family protein [Brachyspira pilosicoli]|uniref:Exo-alpha-sialidase n=1 Tax=Brachyspira pilosicoli TaxID=52584 RepID=A0A5C8EIH8_BRAPL|nr:sialidase family protein [Brachyspira pilosicoli]TXJ37238.1 exo-alpha-sialidase [Brachyspira pilosicoli]